MRSLLALLILAFAVHAQKPLDEKLEERGATSESEEALEKGLKWLALHQAADGSWKLHQFNRTYRTAPLPRGKVAPYDADRNTVNTTRNNDTAGTAFALMPFIAAGHTHKKEGPYSKGVKAGLTWLIRKQKNAGADKGYLGGDFYSHCLGTIALCDAYAATKDATLKGPSQAAINYVLYCQHDGGGWRYAPKTPGDLSVSGFAIRALHSGKRAGLTVPKKALDSALAFVKTCESKGGFCYVPGAGPSPAMTAVGTHSRQLLGSPLAKDARKAALGILVDAGKGFKWSGNPYFSFYAHRAFFEEGGDDWTAWNGGEKGLRDLLIAAQDAGKDKAQLAGSWKGDDHVGGRIGATSMALMSLAVYRKPMIAPRVEP